MTTFPAPGSASPPCRANYPISAELVATSLCAKRWAGTLYDDTPEEIAEHEYAAEVLGWRAKERGMTLDEYLRN